MRDNNIISILDVLLTETTLVTKVESWTGSNLGPLPSRSQIRSNLGLIETGKSRNGCAPVMGNNILVFATVLKINIFVVNIG